MIKPLFKTQIFWHINCWSYNFTQPMCWSRILNRHCFDKNKITNKFGPSMWYYSLDNFISKNLPQQTSIYNFNARCWSKNAWNSKHAIYIVRQHFGKKIWLILSVGITIGKETLAQIIIKAMLGQINGDFLGFIFLLKMIGYL